MPDGHRAQFSANVSVDVNEINHSDIRFLIISRIYVSRFHGHVFMVRTKSQENMPIETRLNE